MKIGTIVEFFSIGKLYLQHWVSNEIILHITLDLLIKLSANVYAPDKSSILSMGEYRIPIFQKPFAYFYLVAQCRTSL